MARSREEVLEAMDAEYELEGWLMKTMLEFDTRWLQPGFQSQDDSGYNLVEATHESLGDVLLHLHDQYKQIHPDWEPRKLCPTCSLLDCENEGSCDDGEGSA